MAENSSSEWAGARGEKWLLHLARTEATLAPVDAFLISALRLDQPARIAEIGCGGGSTTLNLARRAPAGSEVHGFDISPDLIGSARQRVEPGGNPVSFVLGDVGALPPPAVPFDRLTSRFGIMFFDDPPAAFANLARWLSPGGRFAFAVWGPPEDNPWISSVRMAVSRVVELPPSDPAAPGPFRYADVELFRELLHTAGFGGIEVEDWRGMLPIGGGLPAGEAAAYAIASFGSFGGLLEAGGESAIDTAVEALTGILGPHEREGAVRMGARIHIVTGYRA